MAPEEVGHFAVEQGLEAVVDDGAVADVLRAGPPKPVLKGAT